MTTKYVVGIRGGLYVEAIMFSDRLSHDDVGLAVFGSKDNILSAGFCWQDDAARTVTVYGKSHSLKLEPLPELDAYLLGIVMGLRVRLDAFDEDRPPYGAHSSDAEKIIAKRKEKENGQ